MLGCLYLCSEDIQQQKSSDAYLEVTESEFFALDSEDGRKYTLCNLLGLVKFWDEQRQEAESHRRVSHGRASLIDVPLTGVQLS